jgi:hypothetical protein
VEMASKKVGMKQIFLLLLFLFFIAVSRVYGYSPYVLPYPSSMPGSMLYTIHRVWEKMMQFWYFGDFGQFTYNLKESDKNLVQAKTLYEYRKNVLGIKSLHESDMFFTKINTNLLQAKHDGKIISTNSTIVKQAAEKHMEVLTAIDQELPPVFIWRSEKSAPIEIPLHRYIENAKKIRQSVL